MCLRAVLPGRSFGLRAEPVARGGSLAVTRWGRFNDGFVAPVLHRPQFPQRKKFLARTLVGLSIRM
eukprot:572426-Prymnesium_polylepis.1